VARPSPRAQARALALLCAALLGALALTVLLGRLLGAPPGAPCAPGQPFACQNAGFNDARCLLGPDGRAACTRRCATAADCPPDQRCAPATWTTGPHDRGHGRVEEVCQPAP
jgi:hypothetical protein